MATNISKLICLQSQGISKFYFQSILLLILGSFLFSCKEKQEVPNKKPEIAIVADAEGLVVTLTGSVTDHDGSVSRLSVEWGDNQGNNFENINFSMLNIRHRYREPGNYSLSLLVTDNLSDTTIQTISISVDYSPTSLENVKPGLTKDTDNEFLILTLNMHTYQEQLQNEKFALIVDVIHALDIDFIALQECAQHKNSQLAQGIFRVDNMALILVNRLKSKYNKEYNFVWNWAHYGWNVWEEGVAILSKHPVLETEDRYVSASTSISNITSRKVIFGSYSTHKGLINLFSAHTHWRTSLTDEEQNNQIRNIKNMVAEKENLGNLPISIVCGDFNVNPTSDYPWSEGYNTMVANGIFRDTFLQIYPNANNRPPQSAYNTIGGDFPGRIDYIFVKNNPRITVVESQIVFTSTVVGVVSDHYGVITKIKVE
jgi:maltose 6'-phosphate phosphatase